MTLKTAKAPMEATVTNLEIKLNNKIFKLLGGRCLKETWFKELWPVCIIKTSKRLHILRLF